MAVISSTVKINEKSGIFQCDTSRGYFTIYLPLPEMESNSLSVLSFVKVNKDDNKITIKGIFPENGDSVLLSNGRIDLKSQDGEWVVDSNLIEM